MPAAARPGTIASRAPCSLPASVRLERIVKAPNDITQMVIQCAIICVRRCAGCSDCGSPSGKPSVATVEVIGLLEVSAVPLAWGVSPANSGCCGFGCCSGCCSGSGSDCSSAPAPRAAPPPARAPAVSSGRPPDLPSVLDVGQRVRRVCHGGGVVSWGLQHHDTNGFGPPDVMV